MRRRSSPVAVASPLLLRALLLLGLLFLWPLPVQAAPLSFEQALDEMAAAPTEAEFRVATDQALAALPPGAPREIREALVSTREAAWPFQTREAVTRARSLWEAWFRARAWAPASAEEAAAGRERLRRILERPEFTRAARAQDLLARLDRWVKDQLRRLFTGAGLSEAAADLLAQVVLWGLGAMVALAGAAALAALLFALRGRRAPAPAPAPDHASAHVGRDRPAAGWLELAQREAARGEYRLALRYAYLALLRRLDERELIRLDRDRTNWELVGQVSDEALREELASATRLFEARWYAGRPAAEQEYRQLREACTRWG